MPKRTSASGSELFIVDNSDQDWKVLRYLRDWCQISKGLDIATAYFEIGSLLALDGEWQKVDKIRILMGDEVSKRTKKAFDEGLTRIKDRLNNSLEAEKDKNDFLSGVPAIVGALQSGKIQCRVYRQEKFHAKAYITTARLEVVGASALVGSSNFTYPGLTENIELNVQITGGPVTVLQEWYEEHWNEAEDVTPEILRVIERHVREYTPFEVYAKALQELFKDATPGEQVWEEQQSALFHVLDGYQQEGYRNLMRIAADYGGALLCDGVGLGKTYVGLMLIERLIVREGRNVLLLAPKGAVESVWKPALKRYLKKLYGEGFNNLVVASHTDLKSESKRELFDSVKSRAHAIVIDEAHHFRNPGAAGTGRTFIEALRKGKDPTLFEKVSRYRELYNLIPSSDGANKQLFLLTATPINNSFHDLRHMIELFTQKPGGDKQQEESHFGQRLGIHSLTAHFKKMEAKLDRATEYPLLTDNEEAKQILAADPLVSALVVQRSRAFVKEKQLKAGAPVTAFPPRLPPQRAEYSLQKVYGKLLAILEKAFSKETPLFTLPMYYPLGYYVGPSKEIDPGDYNRQKAVVALIRTGFLKRFESSVEAFRASCERLLVKLLGWATVHVESKVEKANLEEWRQTNVKLIEQVKENQPGLFADEGEDAEEDAFDPEWLESFDQLPRDEYNIPKMLTETFEDLKQLAEFFPELNKFDHRNDDKLKKLLKLLQDDSVLSANKVLIFSEFADTAEYLYERLSAAKIEGVERIDGSTSTRERLSVIRRFSPYYNGASSAQLKEAGEKEIRVLLSTDVLSEGLNLQDAARLINYDLHWNPVRLMQRIGRVDRRRDNAVEKTLAEDHPKTVEARKSILFYNFLPPDELNALLSLYSKVTRKTLRISKALGIEGKKLLKEDDDFQDLQHFNESYEGTKSALELLELERDELFKAHPDLKERLELMPLRVFSGKEHPACGAGVPPAKKAKQQHAGKMPAPQVGTRAIFFCYRLPALKGADWTTDGGPVQWLLFDLASGRILEEAPAIAEFIRAQPETPRRCVLPQATLAEVRAKVDKHIRNTHLKRVQAPIGVKPILKAWMELS